MVHKIIIRINKTKLDYIVSIGIRYAQSPISHCLDALTKLLHCKSSK